MTGLLSLHEAQARLLALAEPLGVETLQVEDALGRYLASPLLAARDQPAADLSAMDGYALRPDDLEGPWRVVGESRAGHPYSGRLNAGEAVRVSTGALMPAGECAVLIQEHAQRSGETLSLRGAGEPSARHVRRRGFEFEHGGRLLEAGARIDPPQMALAISGGHAQIPVHRRPSIAIIDSGDELAADPSACSATQVPASNGAMLAALASPFARETRRLGPLSDAIHALVAAFEQSHAADIIVTSGGASVGDHDLVRPALEHWGAALDFWKVAVKPGKPLLVARKGKQIVIGLPGNPVSSYVTAFLFLLPLLRKLGGAARPLPRPVNIRLGAPLGATGDRTAFVRARHGPDGVMPLAQQDSSALAALAQAELLIERPANAPAAPEGSMVMAHWLPHV